MKKIIVLLSVIVIVLSYGVTAWAKSHKQDPGEPVTVTNTTENPVPVSIQSANELFQTFLNYDPTTGTFPTFIAPAGKRVVIQNMSWVALVPKGKTPWGHSYVMTSTFDETFTAAPIWTQISTFNSLQDRFAANLPTLFYIEPGGAFHWGVRDSLDEQPFPLGELNTSLTLTGYVVNVGP
jgi:hypothetical protein